jgi:hypothetical protein
MSFIRDQSYILLEPDPHSSGVAVFYDWKHRCSSAEDAVGGANLRLSQFKFQYETAEKNSKYTGTVDIIVSPSFIVRKPSEGYHPDFYPAIKIETVTKVGCATCHVALPRHH